jgi:hypothetical protein
MSIQLYSIDHVPARVPVWELILDDLGNPSPSRIAKVLGVGRSTVYRWNQLGRAPKYASLSLFWLTRWGRSTLNAQATNDAITACGYVDSLRREVVRLEGNIRHLSQLSTGASNDPLNHRHIITAGHKALGAPR